MEVKSFRFNFQELGGALGDLGTLLPLMVGMILINGLNATSVLLGVGLFYIVAGLYYRIPMPVQPLKAVAAIAISLSLSASVIQAAGLLMGAILLLLSVTNLISLVARLFPRPVVKGIQLSIGLILFRKGIELAFSRQLFAGGLSRSPDSDAMPVGILLAASALVVFLVFKFIFRHWNRLSPVLPLLVFGLGAGFLFAPVPKLETLSLALPTIALPGAGDFWLALTVLVVAQLPLTLGNAVISTADTARVYFKDQANRVTPRALTASMGMANLASGLVGGMPMCHGSGGLTAHYKLGARTGGANLMIGSLLVVFGLLFGSSALFLFSLIPLSVLGILLVIVGTYHAFLVRELTTGGQLAVVAAVAAVTLASGNLAYGFGSGILLYHGLNLIQKGFTMLPGLVRLLLRIRALFQLKVSRQGQVGSVVEKPRI